MIGPGTRVKYVGSGCWFHVVGPKMPIQGPQPGSVWTVNTVKERKGIIFLFLVEIYAGFDARNFVPLEGNEDLSELEKVLKVGEKELVR